VDVRVEGAAERDLLQHERHREGQECGLRAPDQHRERARRRDGRAERGQHDRGADEGRDRGPVEHLAGTVAAQPAQGIGGREGARQAGEQPGDRDPGRLGRGLHGRDGGQDREGRGDRPAPRVEAERRALAHPQLAQRAAADQELEARGERDAQQQVQVGLGLGGEADRDPERDEQQATREPAGPGGGPGGDVGGGGGHRVLPADAAVRTPKTVGIAARPRHRARVRLRLCDPRPRRRATCDPRRRAPQPHDR
jgi:hypothetical protein